MVPEIPIYYSGGEDQSLAGLSKGGFVSETWAGQNLVETNTWQGAVSSLACFDMGRNGPFWEGKKTGFKKEIDACL